MFDLSSLFPCTDPMRAGELSQDELDQCSQDLAAFFEALDEARFGGSVALMSQSAATCETSTTRDVGLSAAMVAIGALATYGIMRRTKTTDDFQRV